MKEEWKDRVRHWSQRVYVDSDEASGTDGVLALECWWRYDSSKDEDITEERWTVVIDEPDVLGFNPEAEGLPEWLRGLVSRIRASSPYL